VTVFVTVSVHPLPWTETVVVTGVHLAVTVLVCVTVSAQPFAVTVVVTGVHFSTDVIVFVFQLSFQIVLTAVQGAVTVAVAVFQPHFCSYSVVVIVFHLGTHLVMYVVSTCVSVIVTNSFFHLTLTTVVGTTSTLVETSVMVLQVLGYLVFQPQDVFHSVTGPPRSTTAAEAAAAKVRMLRKCIVKSTAV